jgi:hypothetical protein
VDEEGKEEETQLPKSKLAKDRPEANEDAVGISLSVAVGMGELFGCVERNKRTNCEVASALKQRTARRQHPVAGLKLPAYSWLILFFSAAWSRGAGANAKEKRKKERSGSAALPLIFFG